MKERISMTIDGKILKSLRSQAKKERRTVSSMIEYAIEQYLDKQKNK